MALLRQCLLELRAAQELAQSREPRRQPCTLAAFAYAPVPGEPMPIASQRLAAGAGQVATRTPSTYPH